jgi:hypothetical protein
LHCTAFGRKDLLDYDGVLLDYGTSMCDWITEQAFRVRLGTFVFELNGPTLYGLYDWIVVLLLATTG